MTTEYTSEFLARYWAKIDCTAGLFECWNWTASKTYNGYGLIRLDKTKKVYTHHVAYELAHGDRNGLYVLHHCDNRACCNPGHLFLGTLQDNSQDMVEKERQTRGIDHFYAKFTEDDIREIRRLVRTKSIAEIARTYGVVWNTIKNICCGKTWKHVIDS